jgi:hypothetical protein
VSAPALFSFIEEELAAGSRCATHPMVLIGSSVRRLIASSLTPVRIPVQHELSRQTDIVLRRLSLLLLIAGATACRNRTPSLPPTSSQAVHPVGVGSMEAGQVKVARKDPEFPSVEDLEHNRSVNPSGHVLTDEERDNLRGLLVYGEETLNSIANERAEAQRRFAQEKYDRGEGSLPTEGAEGFEMAGTAAVVFCSARGKAPRVITIRYEDIPEEYEWSAREAQVRDDTWEQAVSVFHSRPSVNVSPSIGIQSKSDR